MKERQPEKRWSIYINNIRIRGPYQYAETAGAVRSEIEECASNNNPKWLEQVSLRIVEEEV